MIEASPSRCTPEQWTAEQAARAMGVVDEADGEALGVEGAASGEIGEVGEVGREQPNARGGMRWVAGGTALAVVAAAAWWSGAGNRDSREIPVHAAADVALIAGERTPNSGPGDFNSSNGSSHMKIQTTAAAALLGAAASAFQAQAGDAVQWRVEDGGNGHWYQRTEANCWSEADSAARAQGCHLASVLTEGEAQFCTQFVLSESDGITVAIGGFRTSTSDLYLGWRWTTDEAFIPGSLTWMSGNPGCCGSDEYFLGINRVGHIGDLRDCPGLVGAILEWSTDCNSDGIVDYGQILAGTLDDANANGVPDRCECATNPGLPSCCLGDIVNDRTVNGADLGTLLAYWGPVTSGAFSIASDLNNDGDIDGSDLGILLAYWGACPTANVPAWATLIEAMPDPAVVTDPALRTAIAATGLAWRVRDTGTGIEMLLVPPGIFQMGCSQGSNSYGCTNEERPVHSVTLTKGFYLGRYEVTQAQWVAKLGSNPSYFRGQPDSANHPVEQVDWDMVQGYLNATGMRLATEAEWEYAGRAGTQAPFYNGSTDDSTVGALAWYSLNSSNQTHPVGMKTANALGLHDMLGNVWEWVNDLAGNYSTASQIDPSGSSTGSVHVLRGGGWPYATDQCRSSARSWLTQGAYWDYGFRVARNP
jgi:formylglycine-generating enzyme required for sulfatase activity